MTTAETLTLADAIRAVVADYREEVEFFPGNDDPNASVEAVIDLTLAEVDHDDITELCDNDVTGPRISAELAAAYRAVLDADPAELLGAVAEVSDSAVEVVSVDEDADAAVACAAAAAAAAGAATQARDEGDEDAVGVVVVEDVAAACDVDED